MALQQLRRWFKGELPALVVFDLDGTLVDSVPDLATAVDRMLAALEKPLAGEDKVRSWVGNGAEMLVRRALADSRGAEASNCLDRGDLEANVEVKVKSTELESALAEFFHCYATVNGEQTQLYAGVAEVLECFKQHQIPMAVVTNKPRRFAEPLLEKLEISQYFTLLLGGDCLARKKPDPLPLKHCCEHFAVTPETCLMVGDSRNDIVAAKAAGFVSAALTYGYNYGESIAASDPDWVLEDFRELVW